MKTLQVVAPVLSDIVEPDEVGFRRNLEICMPQRGCAQARLGTQKAQCKVGLSGSTKKVSMPSVSMTFMTSSNAAWSVANLSSHTVQPPL